MSTSQTSPTGPQAQAPKSDRYPAGIPFIVGNEGAERFSYYGMRAVLYVYLAALFVRFVNEEAVPAAEMAAARAEATEVAHLFMAGVYLFPLIGAVMADRLLGKYRVILWVSLIYCAGHGVLAVAGRFGALGNFDFASYGMYIGLALIAVGSGGIKPCVSANVGDQFTRANAHLVTRIFQIFYFIINFGSFFSTLLTPWLYKAFGAEVAFGVPGILMGIATFVFWLGRNKFIHQPPNPGGKLGLIDTVATVLLFSPIFAVLVGHFIFHWNYVLPLLVLTAASFGIGIGLFAWRQRMKEDTGFLSVLLYSLRHQGERKPEQGFFSVAREHFGEEAAEGPPAVLRIVVVFSMVMMFWALFDQHASTWIEQASQMDLNFEAPVWLGGFLMQWPEGSWFAGLIPGPAIVLLAAYGGVWLLLHVSNIAVPRKVSYGVIGLIVAGLVASLIADGISGERTLIEFQAAQMAAFNPLLVMLIIPLLNVAVYRPMQKRGKEIKPLAKMTVGMFLAAVAFVAAAVLQARIEAAGIGEVHAMWQLLQYVVMTTAEVLVSVTGLEFAYTQAPRSMKSTIMGFWLLCVTFGNLIVAFLAPLQKSYALSEFFWLFAALMAAAAVLFAVLAYFYKGKSYLQGDTL